MKKCLFLFFLLCTLRSTLCASFVNVHSTFFTLNEGLADNLVRSIYQDSKGFIWFSTLNGLSRYDGYSFLTFRPEKGEQLSLSDRHVLSVTEDQNGFLWIKTSSGVYSCYDLAHDCFVDFTGCGAHTEKYIHRLLTSTGDTWLWNEETGCRKITYKDGKFSSSVFRKETGKLPTNNILQIIEDKENTLWMCTPVGLIKLSGDTFEFLARDLHVISAIAHQENLFFLTNQGDVYRQNIKSGEAEFIVRINSGKTPFTRITDFTSQDDWIIMTHQKAFVFSLSQLQLKKNPLYDIPDVRRQWDNAGNLWLYNSRGRLRYVNKESGYTKDFDFMLSDENIPVRWFHALQDSRGLLWIATYDKGLFVFNPSTDEMKQYAYKPDGLNRVNSNSLVHIVEDRSGSIWVTSESAGIAHLTIVNEGASRVYPDSKELVNQSSSIRMVTCMNDDEIWIGNRKGHVYKYDINLEKTLATEKYNTTVVKMLRDASDKKWIASANDGLCIDGRWYKNQPNNPASLASNKVFDLFCDHQQRMWLATLGGGLDLAIPEKDGSYTFQHFLLGSGSQQEVRTIAADKENWMWVGTSDGVCVFHPDSLIQDPLYYYRYTYANNHLLGNGIKSIFYDSKGRMWLGTMGGGISMCIPQGDYGDLQFTHYTTANGLINNMVQSIIEDREGKLWISTEYGISRFTPETTQFENFLFDNSTLGNVYIENSACLHPDGRLLFGTDHGLVVIDPTKTETHRNTKDVVLTDLKFNGVSVSPGSEDSPLKRTLSYTETLHLKYYQNSFVIEFSTLDYHTLNGTKYTYLLEGFDKEWSIASSMNVATYKNLSPGRYTLKVKACNAVGAWSDKETTLQLVIAPPFWRTTWAYLLYLLITGAIIYLTFRTIRKFYTLHNRIEIERQVTEYKLVFFTNISHEFRTPLTLIQGALERIENSEKLPKEMTYSIRIMEKSTQRMLRLVNQLLEFRKMQKEKLLLQLEETEVISFLRDIANNFNDTATKKQITFCFVPSTEAHLMYIDKGKVDKIVYNLLSNAIKYTLDGGEVEFTATIDNVAEQLQLTVTDNGIGIPKAKQSQLFSRFMQSSFSGDSMGIGLHLTHELVNVHRGRIVYRENSNGGSIFTVTLPLNASIYAAEDFLLSSPLTNELFVQEEIPTEISIPEITYSSDPLNKKKILIIEDDNDVREFLEKELSIYFEVASEPNGLAGLERARSYDADLIVCDVLMPGMTGYEVTGKLKNNFETSHIPIILLTAMSAPEDQLKGTESGADAYITKPFSPKLLLARIAQLITQREKLREKFSNDPNITRPVVSSVRDKQFLDRLHAILDKQIENTEFSADDFAAQMNLGRTSFFRKIRGVTGYSPNEYIRIVRLKKAAELLLDGRFNISEVSYQVGFSSPLYFSKCFKEQFGMPPSAYIKGEEHTNN
ncbi:hybrid sensor histidine kinase/response regulator [Bacteroides sp. 214]|uniref:hybrid sensor histidine kinase/response regulator transcription factor n=1 Tax=Bacteroides sp. 214 TaxID=2302935 RepID=UPI0013D356AE|nr:hybrid sensor histidine kinase/response regulator transcription factor [Bacteroides sp. 214]NDW13371.1 hybrid sensor histidine kinase/response regulator [Bacteroides sp. 214]